MRTARLDSQSRWCLAQPEEAPVFSEPSPVRPVRSGHRYAVMVESLRAGVRPGVASSCRKSNCPARSWSSPGRALSGLWRARSGNPLAARCSVATEPSADGLECLKKPLSRLVNPRSRRGARFSRGGSRVWRSSTKRRAAGDLCVIPIVLPGVRSRWENSRTPTGLSRRWGLKCTSMRRALDLFCVPPAEPGGR